MLLFVANLRYKFLVKKYGSLKSTDFLRSGVALIAAAIASILPAFKAGINASKPTLINLYSKPAIFDISPIKSISNPEILPFSSIYSNGGYSASEPTIIVLAFKLAAVSAIARINLNIFFII